ncbi:MAG: hypothetical protein KatS3mg131_0568 [Candidatus Tectimicrobiota bacterium]|nr:MAG: hypothetical protein KatS3mg131_0568 [Candidatus Tectomicrobia bacterium]
MVRLASLLAGFFAFLPLVGAAAMPRAFTLHPLVTAGTPAPQGGVFLRFDPLASNRQGVILFDALVQSSRPFHGLYLWQEGAVRRVVASGDPLPLGGTLLEASSAQLNNLGHVAFLASARGGVPRAIFLANGSQVQKVVAVRDMVPEGGVLQEFSDITLNDADALAFVARVERGTAPRALLRMQGGTLATLLRVGTPTPLGGRFSQFSNPGLNNRGDVVFEGKIYGGEAPAGIFVLTASGLHPVVAVGEPSPLGGRFQELALPRLNDRGEVLFWAALEGAAAPSGLFLATPETLAKVVARGEAAPGAGRFAFIEFSYTLGETGLVAFQAEIADTQRTAGIFLSDGHDLVPVVTTGQETPLGGRFTAVTMPVLGPEGAVVFAGTVAGGTAPVALFAARPRP